MSTNHNDIMWFEMWKYYERLHQRRVKGPTEHPITDSGAQVSSCVTERLDALERKQAKQERQLAEIEKKYPWGGY